MGLALIISIVVGIFLLVFAVKGWVRGFFRIILTTMSLVLTIVLAAVLMTPITNLVIEKTGIRKSIESGIESTLGWDSDGQEGVPAIDKLDEILKSASPDALIKYLREIGISNPEDVAGELSGGVNEDTVKAAENKIIEGLSFPGILKNDLIKDNNAEKYRELGVTGFKGYIARSISNLLVKILVYIALVIVIYVLIRILLMISKMITGIPIVHGINKLFGLLVGLAEGLLFVWLACFVVTLFAETEFGLKVVGTIHQSGFLTFLYDNNWLMKGVDVLFSMF